MIEIIVYGQASPAGSKTIGRTKAGGAFVRDSAKNSREWKRAVAAAAGERMEGRALLEGALQVEMIFQVVRPKGHFGTGRNTGQVRTSAPTYPTVRPDVLKLARAVEDACTGVVWRDDAQIVREHLSKLYADRACVRIFITDLDAPVAQLLETTTGEEPRREAA